MRWRLAICVGLSAASLAVAGAVQAQITLTVDPLEQSGTGFVGAGTSYTENGFTVTAMTGALRSPQSGNVTHWAGSASLSSDATGAELRITPDEDSYLRMLTVDISEIDINSAAPVNVEFSALKVDLLTTVTQNFTTDGTFGFETFTLSTDFSHVVHVAWSVTGGAPCRSTTSCSHPNRAPPGSSPPA